jgi:hypothetical protein
VWYVTIDGTQHNLGPDREEATRQYHQLMAQPRPKKVLANSVPAVVDAFLDWCQKHRAPDTYEWYRFRLQRFVRFVSGELKTSQLRPLHVRQWIDSYDHLSNGSKRNYCRAMHHGRGQVHVFGLRVRRNGQRTDRKMDQSPVWP